MALSNFLKKLAPLFSFRSKRLGMRKPARGANEPDWGDMGDAMAADVAIASKPKSG